MTSKRTKRRRVKEELEFLYDIEENRSLNLTTNTESHNLTCVVDGNDCTIEHNITEVFEENNFNKGNISPDVCAFLVLFYKILVIILCNYYQY